MDILEAQQIILCTMAEKIQKLEEKIFLESDNAKHYEWHHNRDKEKNDELKETNTKLNSRIHDLEYQLQKERCEQKPVCTPEELAFLMDPMQTSVKKINAIKHVRAITRLGLKEAKEFVEFFNNGWAEHLKQMGVKQVNTYVGTPTGQKMKSTLEKINDQSNELAVDD